MKWLLVVLAAGCGATLADPDAPPAASSRPYALPETVFVKPVFLVPTDQPEPTADQRDRLARHLAWAQDRYGEMLGGQDTFELSPDAPVILHGARATGDYVNAPDEGASQIMAELLASVHRTRFANPYIFVTVLMTGGGTEPSGYGRPTNGGLGGGGGLLVVSSTTLDSKNFQSTLQHELGHTFGLPHVDAYGYDMASNASIMSYNLAQWTDGFTPSPTPGILIPEDLHALAMNHRVFHALTFDPARDVPAGYTLAPVVPLGAMDVPGEVANVVTATTTSGEAYGSSVSHIVQGRLEASRGPGITFDPDAMWHSDTTATGEVSVELVFPLDVTLDEIAVHSQHSGLYHAATAVRIEARPPDSDYAPVASQAIAVDDHVTFPATTSRAWRLSFQATDSQMVVVRGLQFYVDGGEVFPPFVPDP